MLHALMLAATVYAHSGDTYASIASEHGVSISSIEADNHYSATEIPVGASINIPGESSGSSSYSAPTSYGSVYHSSTTTPSSSTPSSSESSSGHTSSSGYEGCVIQHESTGNPSAVNSSSGAGGLYQFLPSTWHSLGYSGSPQDAPVSEQNAAFQKEYSEVGSSAWASDGC